MSSLNFELIREQAFAGVPTRLSNVCDVYPLSMREVVRMDPTDYLKRVGLLTLTESDIVSMIKEKTGKTIEIEKVHILEYLLASSEHDERFFLELQSAFSTFIKEEILLLPKINAVLVGDAAKRKLITEQNFSDFQNIIRIQSRIKVKEPPPENESEIRRKFRLKAEARDAAKKKQQQKKGEEQCLSELLEIGRTYGISLDESYYAFYSLIDRHQRKEKWDRDIQMLCAGADSKKLKTKYWGEKPDDK